MGSYSKKIVEYKCDWCGKPFEITEGNVKQRKKNNKPLLCSDCSAKHKSDIISKKAIEHYENLTEEEKIQRAIKTRNGQLNMSPEAYKSMCENKSKSQIKRFEDPGEREKTRQASLKMWNEMTPKQLEEYSNAVKQGIANMSNEAYESMCKHKSEAALNRHANMTEEEKIQRSKDIINGMKKLTYHDRVKSDERKAILSNEASIIHTKHLIETYVKDIDSTEGDFMRLLIDFKIDFIHQFYNSYPYRKFHELFPNNPVTGWDYVSPFHKWDFLLHTKKTDIFIDIDGSIHDEFRTNYTKKLPDGKDVVMKDYIGFNDSQRPYQTDKLPAYRILAYNDELNMDNTVINIYNSDDIIAVRDLINLFNEYNKQ